MKKIIFIAFLLFSISITAQKIENLKEINTVWNQFYKAFDELNAEYMAAIHSKNLVRVSGATRVLDYDTYINNYKVNFEKYKQNNQTQQIELRFFERLHNDTKASERGIYKLTINKNTPQERSYFGKFHVIFVKENNEWKILVDYDSNENNTISETDFLSAFAMDDFEKFIK